MSLFLDTNVLFAFLNVDDDHHEQAAGLMPEIWKGTYGTPFVSTWVCDELLTLIRMRLRSHVVEMMANELLLGPEPELFGLRILPVGPERLSRVWATFNRYRDRKLSATDASHLVLMEEHGIDALATFERGFDGIVSVVPAPNST